MSEIYFILALFLSSLISGLTGMGGGVLLLSIMLPMFPVNIVIPLHGIIQFGSNSTRVLISLKEIDGKVVTLFSHGALLGAILVIPVDMDLNTDFISILLVISILVFTWIPLNRVILEFKGKFFIIGIISSFLSSFIGSTGPLSAPFFLHSHLKKGCYVATKAACQLPVHLFKVLLYIFSGFILKDWIYYIIIALPVVFTGNMLGRFITQKVGGREYKFIVKVLITLISLRVFVKILLEQL